MSKSEFTTKITPAGGNKPLEVRVLAEGPWDATTQIEQKYGPVRTWWYQPVETRLLKVFKASIRKDDDGAFDVSVRATGPQEAHTIIEKEYGPVRDWLSPPRAVQESGADLPTPSRDLD